MMNKLCCEVCGSTSVIKINETTYECQECGLQYDVSEIGSLKSVPVEDNVAAPNPRIAVNLDGLYAKVEELSERAEDDAEDNEAEPPEDETENLWERTKKEW